MYSFVFLNVYPSLVPENLAEICQVDVKLAEINVWP
jgi:hypothetical protein